MFLTGFVTGFAEQAQSEIAQRNKELRETMDEQFREHKKKTQAAYEVSKAERLLLSQRAKTSQSLINELNTATNQNLQFTVGEQLALIKDEKTFNQFQKDLASLKGKEIGEVDARLKLIKNNLSGVNNTELSIDEAIRAATQVDDIAKPVTISDKTAFGISSNIQKSMLENYKKTMPEAFEEKGPRLDITGTYQPKDRRTPSPSEARKNVTNTFANKIKKNIGVLKQGTASISFFKEDPITNESYLADKDGQRISPADETKLQPIINYFEKETIRDLIEENTTKASKFIPVELAFQMREKFGENVPDSLVKRLGAAGDKDIIFVGDILQDLNESLNEENKNNAMDAAKIKVQSYTKDSIANISGANAIVNQANLSRNQTKLK